MSCEGYLFRDAFWLFPTTRCQDKTGIINTYCKPASSLKCAMHRAYQVVMAKSEDYYMCQCI